MIGSHIGAPTAHTTGRTHVLGFRAGTAFFSHLGIEWHLTSADGADLEALATWIAAHKAHRCLLHGGRVVHADALDPSLWVRGVVAPDRGEAIFALVTLGTSDESAGTPAAARARSGGRLPPAPTPARRRRRTGRRDLPRSRGGPPARGCAAARSNRWGSRPRPLVPERLVLLHALRAG